MAQATEHAYVAIREAILDGHLAPGTWLREAELAGQAGVSRTPVREALRRLQADGLVDVHANRGVQVVTYDDAELVEIYGLRALLEGHAACLAAPAIDPAAVAHLEDLAEAMEQVRAEAGPAGLDRVAELNRDFHATIVGAADSPRLSGLLAGVVLVPLVHRTFHRYSEQALTRSFEHHRELIAAMRAGDGQWAAAVMQAHVYAARAALMGAPA